MRGTAIDNLRKLGGAFQTLIRDRAPFKAIIANLP